MKKIARPQLTFECSEDLNKMKTVENGWHCNSCDKEVIDLTHLSDREFRELLHEKGQFCGRVQANRVSRPLKGVLAASLGILASLNVQGSNALPPFSAVPDSLDPNSVLPDKQVTRIKGTIRNSKNGEPVFQCQVKIYDQSGIVANGLTDFDGNFNYTFESAFDEFQLEVVEGMFNRDTLFTVHLPSSDNRTATVDLSLQAREQDLTEVIEVIVMGLMDPPVHEDSTVVNIWAYQPESGWNEGKLKLYSSTGEFIAESDNRGEFWMTLPRQKEWNFIVKCEGYEDREIQVVAEEHNPGRAYKRLNYEILED